MKYSARSHKKGTTIDEEREWDNSSFSKRK